MKWFRTALLVLTMATTAGTSWGAQVVRSIVNVDAIDMYFMADPDAGSGTPNRQMFRNTLDFVNTLQIQIGGQMILPLTNTVTVSLYDGCGNLIAQASKVVDNSGLTTPTSRKWVELSFGSVPLNYNEYYYFDFKTAPGYSAPKFVANTNRFVYGTLTASDGAEMAFPDKKRDVMFILTGTTDSSKAPFPNITTNIACPGKCVLANPSGVENVSWGADKQFNVIVRERVASMNPRMGSFWSDDTAGTIPLLKQEIAAMLQGTVSDPALREAYPYNNYAMRSGFPFYYPQMNFYIAIEDPAVDVPSSTADGHRGFHHCANIDASIEVLTGAGSYGGAIGAMWGEVNRPAANTGGWGAAMRAVAVHEVFGHGVPALYDEYPAPGALSNYHTVKTWLQKFPNGYNANALPIATGCSEWCGGAQPVSWLVSQMAGDQDAACWSKTTQTTCESPGGFAHCRWIGGLPAIPYWSTYKCIPTRAAMYNVGINCPSFGNHGCYLLAPASTDGSAIMDVVQPSGTIMQSTHQVVAVAGFTSHIETYLKDMLDCVFPVAPCLTTASRCTNLLARYGTPGSGYLAFLQKANACDGGNVVRR